MENKNNMLAPGVSQIDVWGSLVMTAFFGWLSYVAISFALTPEGHGFWGSFFRMLPGMACWAFLAYSSWELARRGYDEGYFFLFGLSCAVLVIGMSLGLFWARFAEPARWIGVLGTGIMLFFGGKITWDYGQALSKPESVTTLPATAAPPEMWDTE